MATATTTLTLCLDHLLYLTQDSNNDTGYTEEEVRALIDENGGDFQIEATITHPVPPPYTVEGDIAAHEERIANDENMLVSLREQLSGLEPGTDEYARLEEQITAVETDIENCQNYIASLQQQ